MVVRTLAFVVVRRLLGLIGSGPAPDAKDVEIAVLQQQPPSWTPLTSTATRRRDDVERLNYAFSVTRRLPATGAEGAVEEAGTVR